MEVIWGNRRRRGDYKYIGVPHFVADAGDDRVGKWLDEKSTSSASTPRFGKTPRRRTWCDSDDPRTASVSYFAYVRLERR